MRKTFFKLILVSAYTACCETVSLEWLLLLFIENAINQTKGFFLVFNGYNFEKFEEFLLQLIFHSLKLD